MRDIRPHVFKCCGLKTNYFKPFNAISSENVGMCAVLERWFEHTHVKTFLTQSVSAEWSNRQFFGHFILVNAKNISVQVLVI